MSRARRPRLPGLFLLLGILPLVVAIGTKALAPWPTHGVNSFRSIAGGQVHVVDGDTLRVDGRRIRLTGIDAPELLQACRDAEGREWPCGRAAKARLVDLASQGNVACTPRGYDRYGRTLAVCSAGGIADLGETLVREGHAVNYAWDGGGYPAAEREARIARRGLWRGDFELPQDWRRRRAMSFRASP